MLYRFPKTIAADMNSQVETLTDGFERLGPDDTPFTLRGGEEKRDQAATIHHQRDTNERTKDEQSNEPVSRGVSEWKQNLRTLDFPFIDTISCETYLDRAWQAAAAVQEHGLIEEVHCNVCFEDPNLHGKFWPGIAEIELAPERDYFPGYAPGPTLAHEVSHSVYAAWTPDAGFEQGQQAFRTRSQQEQAESLSLRLYGPFHEATGPFVDYRLGDEELFAAAFTSRIIEPMAARRNAPQAVNRVEEIATITVPTLFDGNSF
ncbi:hypothetical protein GCM10008985_03770 [Halococcus dombrowskii]|uniref:Uncharacterized protein n=2 Tax=Halococcus dombrowskii TaxID=179637 RepID=A0AAV3SD61_HALDO